MKPLRENAGKPLGMSVTARTKKMPVVDTDGRFKTKNKKHDTKVTKKWNIEDFSMDMLYVQICWHPMPMGRSNTLQLCRQEYEQWLSDTGRLDWYMEGFDGAESMGRFAGSMAIDDYWDHAEYEVKMKDLKDFINARRLIA